MEDVHAPQVSRECPRETVQIGSLRGSAFILLEAHEPVHFRGVSHVRDVLPLSVLLTVEQDTCRERP